MVAKLEHGDDALTLGVVPSDEPLLLKVIQRLVDVDVVIGQDDCLEVPGPVLKSSFAIGVTPKAGEQDALERRALAGKHLVGKEGRLQRSKARHVAPPHVGLDAWPCATSESTSRGGTSSADGRACR